MAEIWISLSERFLESLKLKFLVVCCQTFLNIKQRMIYISWRFSLRIWEIGDQQIPVYVNFLCYIGELSEFGGPELLRITMKEPQDWKKCGFRLTDYYFRLIDYQPFIRLQKWLVLQRELAELTDINDLQQSVDRVRTEISHSQRQPTSCRGSVESKFDDYMKGFFFIWMKMIGRSVQREDIIL